MAWCPTCGVDRPTMRRRFVSICPYCARPRDRAHIAGCRGPEPGALDVCVNCSTELFASALSLSGFEFAKEREAAALRRRRVVFRTLIGTAAAGVLLAVVAVAGLATGYLGGPVRPGAASATLATEPPPPVEAPGAASTGAAAAPAQELSSPAARALRALLDDPAERDALARMALAAVRPTSTPTRTTVRSLREEGHVVVLELEVAWSDRATSFDGSTRFTWRCTAQGHLEARSDHVGAVAERRVDNLFRTSVWPKVDRILRRP